MAGLKGAFQKGALSIRKAFGNVPEKIVYRQYSTSVFTPGSIADPIRQEVLVTTYGFIFDFNVEEVDNINVLAKDRLCTIMALDIPEITPNNNDRVQILTTSDIFEIVRIESDPAQASWKLHIRTVD